MIIQSTPEGIEDALIASLAIISDDAKDLGKRANAMMASNTDRALAAWDYLELAIYDIANRESYLHRAKAILNGADYTS